MTCCLGLSQKQGTLIITGIVSSDCLTKKRKSYLLRLTHVFVKDRHRDVVTGSIRRDKGPEQFIFDATHVTL